MYAAKAVITISAIVNIYNAIRQMAKGDTTKRFPYLQDYQYQRELVTPTDYTSMLEAYKSWVYICASKNSISLASFALRLYVTKTSGSKLLFNAKSITPETKKFLYSKEMGHLAPYLSKGTEVVEILEHPFINLMKNVNPFTNSFELKEMTNLHEELTGNSFWYLLLNGAGLPVEIWMIPPDKMRLVPSKEEFISGYIYDAMPQKIAFTKEEIIHFKFPSSISAYYGMSPLSAVAHAYNLNENMNRYENALFSNMARPDGVLESDDVLGDDNFKRLKKEWKEVYGRVKNSGKTAVLDAGVHYKPISFPPRELAFLGGRKVTREEIMNAYGQSSALYDKEANRANADNATYMHMRDTISPRHRRQEQKINEQLLPRWDERLFCAYDNCIPDDKEFAHLVRMESTDKIITRNEARREIGREEIDGADNLLQDSNQIPIGTTPEKDLENISRRIADKVKEKINV